MAVWALTKDGDLTMCKAPEEKRGIGRCNHVDHQKNGETLQAFIDRIDSKKEELISEANKSNVEKDNSKSEASEITQEEINKYASKLDEIVGEKITIDNYKEILNKLSPEQIEQITNLSFEAAPKFSLPISDEDYEDENIKNKLYFANLPAYGIGGNKDAIKQMFEKVGPTITDEGITEIEHSYKEGLTPDEYFTRQFSTRDAMINKSVSTAKPGYCIWEDSIVEIKDENGNLTKIHWNEVEVGDIFANDSICTEIQDWKKKPCIELKVIDCDPVVVSTDHLMACNIYLNNVKIDNLEASAEARKNIGEIDPIWVCAQDIYDLFNSGAYIEMNGNILEYAKIFKNSTPLNVRCISTSLGYYETNGMFHHNTARKLFYCMSDTQVFKDCGGPYIDAMHCKLPEGHVCEKCANITPGGENVKVGKLIGGLISTNISEALTQLSMKQKHTGTLETAEQQGDAAYIMNTLDGWGRSEIIQKMIQAKTTEEARDILYHGLKDLYSKAGIAQDDFNIQMVAKKLTSYKRTDKGLVPVEDGEKCDIVSIAAIGNINNIFKVSELSTGYKYLTKPMKQELKQDAANQILN